MTALVVLLVAVQMLAAAPRRVKDDNGCEKGLDEKSELDGEIVCTRGGVKTYEGLYAHGKRVGVAKTWRDDGKLASVIRWQDGKKNGLCEEYSREGKLEEACEFKNDERDGPCKRYDREGRLREERRYVAGDERGLHVEYHPNGKVRERGLFDDQGKRDGLYERFREDGKPESLETWSHGQQNGPDKRWHSNGNLRETEEWKDGERHGLNQSFHESGQLRSTVCVQHGTRVMGTGPCTGKSGPEVVVSYFPNGRPYEKITVDNGKLNGAWERYSADGVLLESARYADSKRDGVEKRFDKAGKLSHEQAFVAGRAEGVERTFFEDGGPVSEEVVWKDGRPLEKTAWWMNGKKKLAEKRDGEVMVRITWHDTGKQASEETFGGEAGYRQSNEGRHKKWNDQGTLLEEVSWKAGKRDGVSRMFYEKTGKPFSEETWADGVRTARKEWDEQGKLVKDEQYNKDGSRK